MTGICFVVETQNFKPKFSAYLSWVIQYLFCGHACVYVDIKKISLNKGQIFDFESAIYKILFVGF
jgi:hypothetical protein